jgi:hypothetical protein
MAGLALMGAVIAGYLAAYQLDLVASVWDPFFGDGSRRVLDSPVSGLLPVPDALAGSLAYLVEATLDLLGGTERWRRRPWLVLAFGGIVIALGAVSVALVILQPLAFRAWCSLCLASALISFAMVGLAGGEVRASLELVWRARREGGSAWRAILGQGRANS